jgi:hypothetical protein
MEKEKVVEKSIKPELCDRCHQVMSEIWFHKKDDYEDLNICMTCFEEEYGAWSMFNDDDIDVPTNAEEDN